MAMVADGALENISGFYHAVNQPQWMQREDENEKDASEREKADATDVAGGEWEDER